MRALPTAVAVLLLIASVAGAVGPVSAGAVAFPAVDEPAPDRPQVDDENRTFRTLSTANETPARAGTTVRGANLGSALDLSVDDADAAIETAAIVRAVE
ncbi:hypothetical protein GJ633_16560, partial [Halorubrum sp. CBA1125]|nr:hypothetical protein [Halorubrum sp. CBA1125]